MIKGLRRDYPVRVLCRMLEVSRRGFRARLVRQPSARARARERLKAAAAGAPGLPVARGIHATVHAAAKGGVSVTDGVQH